MVKSPQKHRCAIAIGAVSLVDRLMYDRSIMKLTPVLLLTMAPFAISAAAQTTAKAPIHHTTAAAHKTTESCSLAAPTLPIAVPKVAGCPKPLYSLTYTDQVVGTGAPVSARKWLTVAYTGYLTDGTKFDSSIGKDPITFPYGAHQVIAGWDTGFEGMNIGGKRRLYIPYELAYGEQGRPPVIPAKAELVFDLELIAISDTPPAPKTPPAAPAPAGTTPPASSSQPAATKPATDAPSTSGAQSTVGKPTATPAPDASKTAAPTDPTKPAAVPPK